MSRPFQSYPFASQHFPARLPEMVGGVEPCRYGVVIAGGGIAGLCTALGLARHGVRSVVIEADDSVCVGSRAVCISRRSLEILSRLGALERLLEKGLPWTGGRSFYRATEVLHFRMPHDENQRLPPMINIPQYYLEHFLLEAAERTGLIDVRWQSRVRNIRTRVDDVRLSIDTPLGAYQLETDWLVGCDGSRSTVREAAGLKLHGTSYEGRYVIADIALRSARPTERLAWFDPPSNPGATILMHRQPDDVWRIDYQLREGEDPEAAIRPENVIPRIASHLRMIGEPDDWAPIWISLYKASALTLEQYRKERLLLAGDAAHLVPIFGVRGANSSIEDADNLAWKLSLVVQGIADESLLDSYSTERVGAARENLRQGAKSTEFMAPPSFGFELMRTAVLKLAIANPSVRSLINPRQTQASSYRDSPLSTANGAATFIAGPGPGDVAHECPVTVIEAGHARVVHLTELLGQHFTAFCFTTDGTVPDTYRQLGQSLRTQEIPFRLVILARGPPTEAVEFAVWDHTKRLFPLYGAFPGSLYLFRPDGHVIGRWHQTQPLQVANALLRILHPNAKTEAAHI